MSDDMTIRPLTCDDLREMAGAFVLGALDPAEEAAVRAHLETCPDAHDEIAELGSVLPVLDASVPVVEPPAALKSRLMTAAAADLASRQAAVEPAAVAGPGVTATEPIPFPVADAPATTERPRTRGASPATWALRIAAVLVIGILAGWNLLLQGQLSSAEQYQQDVAAVLDMAARPGSLTAVLSAEGGSGPSGLAAVSATGDVTLAMTDLAATTGTEVYEAWVIGADGTPVPIGSFAVGGAGTAYFEGAGLPAEAGIVLALTREPGPGATTPTLPIVSSGTAAAAG